MGNDTSPFHRGEKEIQSRLGIRDKMERLGRKVIRDHLPQDHREFFRSGRNYRERCFMAANRVGKTEGAGGYELACLASSTG